MKVSKSLYLQVFGIVVVVLALFRCACPEVAMTKTERMQKDSLAMAGGHGGASTTDTITTRDIVGNIPTATQYVHSPEPAVTYDKAFVPHPIYSVPRFKDCFPDSQAVHLSEAEKWGVKPVTNRLDAEKRMSELVYIGANPYFYVDNLKSSIPYLVPRASTLLNDIGRAYFDSLYVKGIPFHKILITSVLRTREDIGKLQKRNINATDNSCHLYGTTFDIAQNRYKTVYDPRQGFRREVQNDTLKWILSEVLRDFREAGRCYIKYEVKQGCFHVTVR
ncbi:hypothetical protein E5358_02655 [Palleniella muris]|uniref:Uncharacterized protein n=1 Tax=Palleniella muris TaxID=3038145 RepID=A0AC61QT59_9BACT|nr:DUF5715 family protein [Palleniella muris]TGX83564.1 hypothetical protein E5358_02655 [Palleniella muris]